MEKCIPGYFPSGVGGVGGNRKRSLARVCLDLIALFAAPRRTTTDIIRGESESGQKLSISIKGCGPTTGFCASRRRKKGKRQIFVCLKWHDSHRLLCSGDATQPRPTHKDKKDTTARYNVERVRRVVIRAGTTPYVNKSDERKARLSGLLGERIWCAVRRRFGTVRGRWRKAFPIQ